MLLSGHTRIRPKGTRDIAARACCDERETVLFKMPDGI